MKNVISRLVFYPFGLFSLSIAGEVLVVVVEKFLPSSRYKIRNCGAK